eukprot:1157850-Pelagomonas_calceolata.AAC.22
MRTTPKNYPHVHVEKQTNLASSVSAAPLAAPATAAVLWSERNLAHGPKRAHTLALAPLHLLRFTGLLMFMSSSAAWAMAAGAIPPILLLLLNGGDDGDGGGAAAFYLLSLFFMEPFVQSRKGECGDKGWSPKFSVSPRGNEKCPWGALPSTPRHYHLRHKVLKMQQLPQIEALINTRGGQLRLKISFFLASSLHLVLCNGQLSSLGSSGSFL